MGKKIKKEEKGTAEDTFDTLLVESHQAETVVLMLDSPEEDVQIKACQAIYKFITKCDENKEVLYMLNVLAKLHLLMKSEDRTVRRDSVMVMGIMTENDSVKKSVRKEGRIMKILLQLLSEEEYPTTNEFAAMALTNLCSEYTSIAQLLENNGIANLVECLSSDDPDVQKNSITCLDLVLRDFEARPVLRSCDGLGSIMELTRSEYPVIQDTALRALSKAVLDSTIRGALREMDCINRLVDIIGRPEYNDVHCVCLQVLSILLEDLECVKQMKENGGLVRLIAFISDAQPPEEEPKEKLKKSSKAGSAKKKKEKEEEKPKELVSSATLPEVKIHACKAIMRACQSEDVRRLMHDCDVERLLVTLLSHEVEPVRVAAAGAAAVMATGPVGQASLLALGAVETLVRMAGRSDRKEMREAASLALANLTADNPRICQEVAGKHGLEPLVACLSSTQESVCSNALAAIANMATEESLRTKLLQYGLVKALVAPLKSQSTIVQSKAALVVAGCLLDIKSRNDFRSNSGIGPLVELLMSPSADVRRAVCWAVAVIAADRDCAEALAVEGAIRILQQINRSESRRNKFSEAALNRLYDSNLNLKYALTGFLDFTDQVGDLFFDCGQQRPDATMLSLEQYCQQPINNHRPVILVNTTQPPKPVTPTNSSNAEFDEKRLLDDKLTPKKSRSRSKRDRRTSTTVESGEENAAVEVTHDSAAAAKLLPLDAQLLKMQEELVETVETSINTVEAQIVELAKYVASCMGGPIQKDDIMSIPYELSISQLKIDFGSNVVPLGSITMGIHVHRALLFKYLADKLCLPTNLHRGEYNRSWNEVWIFDTDQPRVPKATPCRLCIVDLMHEPGRLILKDSPHGHAYCRL